jgi:hypothetical protein
MIDPRGRISWEGWQPKNVGRSFKLSGFVGGRRQARFSSRGGSKKPTRRLTTRSTVEEGATSLRGGGNPKTHMAMKLNKTGSEETGSRNEKPAGCLAGRALLRPWILATNLGSAW